MPPTTTSLAPLDLGPEPTAADPDLAALVDRAARLTVEDAAWQQLRADAAVATAHLAAAGRIPGHLVVTTIDPPVVVARTLAAVARRVR